jgi:NADPH:quinone reductase
MRAFTLDSFGVQPSLREDLPEPEPDGNELLIRVQASSVNPADTFIASGAGQGMMEHEFPVTLGRDFAGLVERVGPAAGRFQAGEAVFGFVAHANPTVHHGSWAELIAVPENFQVAAKPGSVDVAGAGAAPLAAISALAAFDALAPTEGTTVLVVGAAGGVGSFFVQLAASAGATIIAPALAEDEDYLRELGVAEVLDRNANVGAQLRAAHPEGVDAILDVVSQTPDESLLKEGGRLASTIGAAGEGERRFNVMAEPTTANLERLAGLLADGTLRVPIQRTYAFDQVGRALEDLVTTHNQGKLALTFE